MAKRPDQARRTARQREQRDAARKASTLPGGAAPVELPPELLAPLLELTRERAIEMTEQTLLACLPEAARALHRTLLTDPARGFALRAAEILLKHFPVEGEDGAPRHLLEAPAKAQDATGGTKIIIGLHVDAGGGTRAGQVVATIPPALTDKSEG